MQSRRQIPRAASGRLRPSPIARPEVRTWPMAPPVTGVTGEPRRPEANPGLLDRRVGAQQRADQAAWLRTPVLSKMRCSWVRSVLTLTPSRSAAAARSWPSTISRASLHLRRREAVDLPRPRDPPRDRVGIVEGDQRPAVLEQHPTEERHPRRRPRRAAPPRPASADVSGRWLCSSRDARRTASRKCGVALAAPRAQAAGGGDEPGWSRIRSRASRFVQRIRASASTSISGQLACSTAALHHHHAADLPRAVDPVEDLELRACDRRRCWCRSGRR